MDVLERTVQILDIANRGNERIYGDEAKDILEVIANYSKALNLLDDHDYRTLNKVRSDKEIKTSNLSLKIYINPSEVLISTLPSKKMR